MSMKQTLIGLGLVAASGAALALPNIAVLATGGTIAGAGASATGTAYQAGKVSVNHLVAAVPELANIANVTPKQVAQIGSQDMSDEVWLKLAQTINADCKKYDGFVITHGTDTMEETAYFLNLTLKCDKPVAMVGAMLPSTGLGADGPGLEHQIGGSGLLLQGDGQDLRAEVVACDIGQDFAWKAG